MKDNTFNHLTGTFVSAIAIFTSDIVFLSRKDDFVHFSYNFSPQGTTIYADDSTVLLRDITMENNYGYKGGCINIVNSELDIERSLFRRNIGIQGGVIFAIQRSLFRISDSLLFNNISNDGGVIYAMSC